MVLKYNGPNINPFGRLIDFDYGGKVETSDNQTVQYPKYPSGYVYRLDDGFRPGLPGEDITFEHDWLALGSVILELYNLVEPATIPEGKTYTEIAMRSSQLSRMRDAFLKWNDKDSLVLMQNAFSAVGEDCTIIPSEKPGPFLRLYLDLAQKNEFLLEPTRNFKGDMKDCNMIKGRERIDSNGATGSPKIK